MSYQVLARKYRPANFEELEGQEHVLRALINSLEHNRLHHAYLFAGTRGVGKTTIARILAKCLNCETGITSKPCGQCSTCLEIAEGRSVDLIEVDAASRTRVEDTRDLLDNVQYMPTHSRFKVYLIDEVHMLSNHSFNALLKTLEEPPEHVKFLLATTDPKKLPVTVLSRCLQFNLKNLSPERVVTYLERILARENIDYEEPALWQLGRAADGSMRDALSLTDQAISFGDNRLTEADVRAMLGTIDHREVYELLDALIAGDAGRMLERITALAEFGPDYEMLLAELLRVLHRVAVAQAVPEGVDNSHGDRELVLAVAGSLGREDVQLYYQIGLIGQRDLPLAPDPREGFEMVMLRMLAFAPQSSTRGNTGTGSAGQASSEGTDKRAGSRAATSAGKGARESVESATTDAAPQTAPAGNRTNQVADILATINAGGDKPSSRRPARAETAAKTAPAPVPPAIQEDDSDEIPWGDTQGVTASAHRVESRTETGSGEAATRETPAENDALTGVETPTGERDVPAPASNAGASMPAPVETAPAAAAEPAAAPVAMEDALAPDNWNETLARLQLKGVTGTLAANCVIGRVEDTHCVLILNEQHASLWNKSHETRIGKALSNLLGRELSLSIEVGTADTETPAQIQEREAAEQRARAIDAIENDDKVRQLIDKFGARLNVDSIVPRT